MDDLHASVLYARLNSAHAEYRLLSRVLNQSVRSRVSARSKLGASELCGRANGRFQAVRAVSGDRFAGVKTFDGRDMRHQVAKASDSAAVTGLQRMTLVHRSASSWVAAPSWADAWSNEDGLSMHGDAKTRFINKMRNIFSKMKSIPGRLLC